MNEKICQDFSKFDYNTFADLLLSLNSYEFTLIATILGFFIAKPLSATKQNSLGNFFELLGQVMLTISAQNFVLAPSSVSANDFNKFKEDIEKRLDYLAIQIEKLKR